MRLGLALIVLGLVFAAPARATVIPVTTFDDPVTMGDCSLREAIDAANSDTAVDTCPLGSGDDVIRLGTGTYVLATGGAGENANLTGDLDAVAGNGALTIEGTGATTISAQGLGDRVLDIRSGETVTLRGVTITGGAPPGEDGGGIRNAGTLSLVDVALVANRAADGAAGGPPSAGHSGGGIWSSGALSLLRSTISDNVAGTGGRGDDQPGVNGWPGAGGGPGGGIFATGPLTIDRSRILRNHAGAGGRGGDGSIGGDGGNGGDGGGLGTAGPLTMTSTLVQGNTTGAGGAGGIADSGQGGQGGDGGDGGGVGAGAATSVAFSTLHANTVGGGGMGGLNVDQTTSAPAGTAGIGTAIAGQATLARTVAAGTCVGALTDGGANLGGTGCPGSHAAPALSAAGVPGAGSPAIDAAPVPGCPATDLAGRSRPQGIGCDIGAYEAAAGTLAFSPTALTFRTTRVGGVRRLAVTVTNTGLAGLAVPTPTVTGGPHFRLGAVTCSASLVGLGSCSVGVNFTPKRKGTHTGSLRIGARAFPLSGRAVLRCVVPKLKGKTLKKARKALRKAHCTLGTMTRRVGGRPGRIRRSRPKARSVHPAGTAVNVVVNRRR
ncbi:MAG TPA: choice-of-anchor D domain-containing protein [Solirubrobacteraceae bacterium]|nr:choice-of-anchor D domain-containing protein [Solirubrobacteraceae bacterium]